MLPPPNVVFCLFICRQCGWHQACADTEPLKQRAELWAVLASSLPYHHPTARSHWTSVRDLHINKHRENQWLHILFSFLIKVHGLYKCLAFNTIYSRILFSLFCRSHLQILISPNPSLATKSSMLPWSGQIYVQCDNQQKVFISGNLCAMSDWRGVFF